MGGSESKKEEVIIAQTTGGQQNVNQPQLGTVDITKIVVITVLVLGLVYIIVKYCLTHLKKSIIRELGEVESA